MKYIPSFFIISEDTLKKLNSYLEANKINRDHLVETIINCFLMEAQEEIKNKFSSKQRRKIS